MCEKTGAFVDMRKCRVKRKRHCMSTTAKTTGPFADFLTEFYPAGLNIHITTRARICKRLWSPGIDSEESISLAHVAWRASTTNRIFVPARQAGNRYLGSLKGLQIRAPGLLSFFPNLIFLHILNGRLRAHSSRFIDTLNS